MDPPESLQKIRKTISQLLTLIRSSDNVTSVAKLVTILYQMMTAERRLENASHLEDCRAHLEDCRASSSAAQKDMEDELQLLRENSEVNRRNLEICMARMWKAEDKLDDLLRERTTMLDPSYSDQWETPPQFFSPFEEEIYETDPMMKAAKDEYSDARENMLNQEVTSDHELWMSLWRLFQKKEEHLKAEVKVQSYKFPEKARVLQAAASACMCLFRKETEEKIRQSLTSITPIAPIEPIDPIDSTVPTIPEHLLKTIHKNIEAGVMILEQDLLDARERAHKYMGDHITFQRETKFGPLRVSRTLRRTSPY